MNTNHPAFRIAGIVLLILATLPQGAAAPPTLPRENPNATGRVESGNSDGPIFAPLYSAPARRPNHAILAAEQHPRYAAIGSSTSTNGLVGWWKLDETEGTLASDSSGNGYNGTTLNGPAWTTGQLRGALNFDGTNDLVICADTKALRITGDLTIAFWTKKNAEAKKLSCLVGKANPSVRNYGIWEEAGNEGRLLFQQLNAAGQGINLWTSRKLALGTWYHVAAVVQGSNVSFYINGKLDGSKARTIAATTTTDPLAFGYGGWNDHYPGVLDDIRIYNRPLSAEEIAELHSAAAPDRRKAGRNLDLPATRGSSLLPAPIASRLR